MILIGYILLFAVMAAFYVKFNRLRRMEVLTLWLVHAFLAELLISLFSANVIYIERPKTIEHFAAFMLHLLFLIPIAVLYIHCACRFSSGRLAKIIILIVGSAILTGGEAAAERLRVIVYRDWNLGYSYAMWSALLLASIGTGKLYSAKFAKEKPHGAS